MKIAIIGMAGRFPGCSNLAQFWDVLKEGKEPITSFCPEELLARGFPESLIKNPNFIPRRGIIPDLESFDASFFFYSPKEAELIDPQQRQFLECAWHVFEDAGYHPRKCTQSVGVFAGSNQNTYLLFHILSSDEVLGQVHGLAMHSDKDFLSTRVSHKLNLQGPSMSIQTACSTSLVCVHQACQSLLSMECDMALAGGVSIVFPNTGYFYQEGGVFSSDGKCRPFDHKASGTLGGDGVGVVLLKRLEDALRDGDQIHAVILSSAVNNDGLHKPSFAAPSVDGQMRVIQEALSVAELDGESIGYIEGHGTGTLLGDLIELTALKNVFEGYGCKPGTKILGSLKSNIGHLDQASGIAGLMKTVMILKEGVIPPTLHFESFNKEIHVHPFTVNRQLQVWEKNEHSMVRRAGVSSFGFGGTNAHIILEEAPKNGLTPQRSAYPLYPFARQKYFIAPRILRIGGDVIANEPHTDGYKRPPLATTFAPPQSKIESILVEVWEKHLGIQNIGIDDDFFELGGHSLLATQVIASVKEMYPIGLEVHELMENTTIKKIATLIEEKLIGAIEQMTEESVEKMLREL